MTISILSFDTDLQTVFTEKCLISLLVSSFKERGGERGIAGAVDSIGMREHGTRASALLLFFQCHAPANRVNRGNVREFS